MYFDQTDERVGLFDRAVRGFDPYRNQISPNQSFAAYFPGDYGDSRGFEISLQIPLQQSIINIDIELQLLKINHPEEQVLKRSYL
ncbi:MAG: hypothetical protein MZV64_69290 [Ignavibacteriales bacterium]|nr:hypothetical protein [Ignavibacteriales bacterium]